jgi:hypothetical protein
VLLHDQHKRLIDVRSFESWLNQQSSEASKVNEQQHDLIEWKKKVLYLSASIPLISANRADLFSVAATVPLNPWLYSAEEMSSKRIAQHDHKPQSPYRCPLERGGDCALRSGRTDRSDAIFCRAEPSV